MDHVASLRKSRASVAKLDETATLKSWTHLDCLVRLIGWRVGNRLLFVHIYDELEY